MEICGCRPRCECSLFSVIVSAVIGIIAAFLNFSGTIAVPPVVLWVFFGVVLGFLAISLIAVSLRREKENSGCLCTSIGTLLAGVLITVLFALVLLVFDIATAGILGSVITGLLFAGFSLTVTSVVCLVKALSGCR